VPRAISADAVDVFEKDPLAASAVSCSTCSGIRSRCSTWYPSDASLTAARHCLLFEAVRNGRALIGVVLGSPATGPAAGAQDAEKMLNWGFRLRPRALR